MSLARDDIKKAIIEAIMIRSLGENAIPQEAFYCPCGNEQKHVLLITKSITGERMFTCTKDPTKHIDDDRSWIDWLDISKNDGQLTDSDTSTATVNELSLDDHNEVFGLLNNSITKWDVLGLKLDVRYTELDKIQTDCKDIDSCLMKMLAAWLKQSSGKGPPTYKQLVEALESMGEATLANEIKRSLSKRKGSKSDASASKRQCM
ncbi:PREDICTED: uncharacterized protein LOC109592264 [Amphimedon queenslandica]|uniref:Death domain-containing protein n=2 Tax=Amphimedon queenslandica TaxID=400682 RepID=A0AAN0K2E5_AMPQE|nr:PREDICTED: uncharacterized protein LOC109592264 [Amphimedon queenslandica]|eukprot:XP_019863317.1 PREDICTED: uncharacterized protein LOC109592264 [Amphimedon queenslandica]